MYNTVVGTDSGLVNKNEPSRSRLENSVFYSCGFSLFAGVSVCVCYLTGGASMRLIAPPHCIYKKYKI